MGSNVEQILAQLRGQNTSPPSSSVDSVLASLRSEDPYAEDQAGEPESFWNYLGNLGKYTSKLIFQNPYAQQYGPHRAPYEMLKGLGQGLYKVSQNLFDTENRNFGYQGKPVKEITGEVWKNLTGSLSGMTPGSIPKGLLEMTVEPLLETFSGTTKVGDTPVISTVSERAKAIQEVAANFAMGVGYAGTSKLLLAKATPIGVKALLEQGTAKTLGKAAMVSLPSAAAAGAAGAAVTNAGSDDLAIPIISGALAGIPLGIFPGMLFEGARLKSARLQEYATARLAQKATLNDITQEWSALHGLASSEASSLETLVNNIDAFASSENIIEAVARSTVNNQQGWIVPNVDDATLTKVTGGISRPPSEVSPPLEWLDAPRAAKLANPTFMGMKIKWGSAFDKVAYILSNPNSKAKSYSLLADEATKKFGVSLDDMVAHGKYVRASIKNMISGGKIERLTEDEIQSLNRGINERGRKLISQIPDGGQIQDYNNTIWTRQGNTLTNGQLTYPVNDNSIINTIGRKPNTLDPLSGKVNLPALDFRPDFQRAVGDFHLYKYLNEDKTYDLLLSPSKLEKKHATFYEQTGFLPGEVVALDGATNARVLQRGSKPNTFHVSTVGGKKGTRVVNASRLQHHPDGIKSAIKGLETFEATPSSVFEKFHNEFINEFNRNILSENQQSFDNIFNRVRIKYGINEASKESLKISVYRRLQDDYIGKLDEAESGVLRHIRDELEGQEEALMSSKMNQIEQYATNNQLYVRNKGAGNFEIRQAVDDKLVHTFSSYDEALTFLRKSGKNPNLSIDLDGGTAAPSAIANLGGYAEKWEGPVDGWWTRKMDRLQTKWAPITSSQELFHSLAGVFDDTFGTNTYFKNRIAEWVRDNQYAAQSLRRFHEFNSKELSALYNKLSKATKGMNGDQLETVLGYVETLSPEEIQNKLINRKASSLEMRKAVEWSNAANKAGFSMTDVEDLFHAGTKAGKPGTPEFEAGVQNYVKNGYSKDGTIVKIDQSLANIVLDLGRTANSQLVGGQPFSKYLTLKLADAYQFPDHALSRTEYFHRKEMTPELKAAAEVFEELVNKTTDLAGIPKNERINFHVPSIRMLGELNAFTETSMPEELLHGLSKATIGDNRTMIRDPMTLAYKYIDEVGRHKTTINIGGEELTYNQAINKLRDEAVNIANEVGKYEAKANGTKNFQKGFRDYALKHMDELQGKSEAATHIRNGMKQFYSKLGMSEKASSDMATNLIAAATQGGNQIMWIRDVVSAGGIAWSLFGKDFAAKAIFTPVNKAIIESLERRGKIPIVGASDIASPHSVRMTGDISTKVAKMADQALTLSGQHHIYRHRLAGIYLATEESMNKWLPKLQRGEINKKIFYDNINIDVHPRAVQTFVDKLISSGDTQAAIDYLAQQNTKRIMNLFGYANTPIGWTSHVGKLLGQYGSWSANNIATSLNSTRNLASANGIKRMLRFSAYTGALKLTGMGVGLNLNSFQINPLQSIPGVGPIADIWDEGQKIAREFGGLNIGEGARQALNQLPGYHVSPDWERTLTTDWGRLFVPYSYATENLLKGLIDLPGEGYTPIQSALKMIGFKPTEPQ